MTTTFQKTMRKLSNTELDYAIADLRAVIAVQEQSTRDGHHCPKLGEYWDDLFAACDERKSRGNRKPVAA